MLTKTMLTISDCQMYKVIKSQFFKPFELHDNTIKPIFTNQLGNNLFQYVYSRLRAKYLGIIFSSDVELLKPFDKLENYKDYSIKEEKGKNESRFLTLSIPNRFAQNFKYYENDVELIRRWMCRSVEHYTDEIEEKILEKVKRKDTLVIHLRYAKIIESVYLADPTYHELPMSYYDEIIEKHKNCKNIIFVYDKRSKSGADILIRNLKKRYNFVSISHHCESLLEDFLIMYHSCNLALSVSTFSWWAAFLSVKCKNVIYYPYHINVPWYNIKRLKTWFNFLLPKDKEYAQIFYKT